MGLKKNEAFKLIKLFNSKLMEKGDKNLVKSEMKYDLDKIYDTKAVLGFDIYRYSQYERFEQTLIPHLFKTLYSQTIDSCLRHEPFFFQKTKRSDLEKLFIDSGDGGFQIFDTPMHAIIFAIYFQSNIKRYNSGHITTISVNNIIGEVNLRYSLTWDEVFFSEKNFYGPAIINNARIMAKDKLNRFLLDSYAIKWFNNQINGLDTIQTINIKEDFINIPAFSEFDEVKKEKENASGSWSILCDSSWSGIISSDILHIGEIKSKLDTLNVYSVHIQAQLRTAGADKLSKLDKIVASLGNLNSSGINESI